MKRQLLKSMLLLCALVVGSSNLWAATKTETFEGKATATNYQGTVTVSTTESSCGIEWTIYYGCVSGNDKISGDKSAQMRWYGASAHVGNYPYIKTTTAIDGLTNVALKARTSSTNLKMDVCYSSNGTAWTVGKTHTFTNANTAENVDLDIPSGNKYVKFEVNSSSTAPGSSANYKMIVDDIVFTYSSGKQTATWSVEPTSATIEMGGSTNLQLTTNYDGTLSFESADTDIATVSYNSSTKVITINGIAAGSTTITATGTATSTYDAISKNINVSVTHPELTSNVTDILGPLGYSYFGLTPSGTNTYVNLDDGSIAKTGAYGVGITLNRNGNSYTKLRFDGNYMRLYNGNSIVVAAPTGSSISKIVFTEPSSGASWAGTLNGSVGDYVDSEKTWYATTNDVTSIELTSDNTKRIGGIEVYINANSLPITISAAGLATFATDAPLDYSGVSGIEAYIAKENGYTIELTKVNKVPANTGVLLRATAGGTDFTVPVTTASTDDVTGNIFVRGTGAAVATGSGPYNWILSKKGDVYGFYHANGNTVATNRAYLQTTNANARISLDFGEDVTAFETVKTQKADGQYYNLAGQRVAQPIKGLYIVNGKKVVIK